MATRASDGTVPAVQAELDRVRDLCEVLHMIVDFVAGISFVIGSALFFFPAWATPAIWLFLIGSVAFAAKPTIRLIHAVADRRTRRRFYADLSAEAVAELHRLRPPRLLHPLGRL